MSRLVLVFCVLALALVAAGCGGDDNGEVTKSMFIELVEEGLEDQGMPREYTDCVVARLDRSPIFTEIEEAHNSLADPEHATPAELQQALGPRVTREVAKAGTGCARQIDRSHAGQGSGNSSPALPLG